MKVDIFNILLLATFAVLIILAFRFPDAKYEARHVTCKSISTEPRTMWARW